MAIKVVSCVRDPVYKLEDHHHNQGVAVVVAEVVCALLN